MDRLQQKRSSNHGRTEVARGEGNKHSRRRVDSNFHSSIPTEKNSFVFELKQSSSNQVNETVTPMKLLLAEEMSKEVEYRRRSPSVIAKLMGLDALPTQQPVHRQQKKVSNRCSQRMESVRFQEQSPSHYSFQKNSTEKHQFKDVFEVMESSNAAKHSSQLVQKGMETSKPTDTKMDFIRKKFTDAKRLSTDENLRQSKEFHDALEALNSNKDLLLRFLQEPDSLFNKHLHNLNVVPTSPQPSHIRVSNPTRVSKYKNRDVFCESQGKRGGLVQMNKDPRNSLQKHEKGRVSHNRHTVYLDDGSLKSPYDRKTETCLLPTRIVVLKPTLWKQQKMERTAVSPKSLASSNSRHRELSSRNWESVSESRDRMKSVNNVELSRSRQSREIARDITRKMRQSARSGARNVSASVLKGYAGDESSCSMSGKDSMNDSEASMSSPTSRNFYGSNKMFSPSSSFSSKSSVNREARKHLSERLKTTHTCQVGGMINSGPSTLGEMLALSDKETELMTLNTLTGQFCSGHQSTRREAVERWDFPLGISSKDGWKGGSPRNLTRSRSLPASSTLERRPKISIKHGIHSKDDSFMLKENINLGPDRALVEDFFNKKEKTSPKSIRFSSKRARSSIHERPQNNLTIREIHASPEELRKLEDTDKSEQLRKLEDADKSEQWNIVPESSASGISETRQLTDVIAVSESEDVTFPSKFQEKLPIEPMDCITLVKDYSTSDQTDLIIEETPCNVPLAVSHCHVTESDSPQSSKEPEQPSPVSVLEPPFEEVSHSDCFESVTADLQGLRMQLKLLKLESTETFADGSESTITSDDDFGDGYSGLVEKEGNSSGMFKEENKSYSYLVDVLTESGFHGVECDWLNERLHSSEFPLGQGVFENLERKYGSQMAWPRSERRLLFDQINSRLVEILGPYLDLHPWVKLKGSRAGVAWDHESLLEVLWQFLAKCGKEGNGDMEEMFLGWEGRRLEMGDKVDGIGREMERVLINELIEDFVQELSFNGEM